MIQRKDGSDQNLEDRNRTVSSDFQRVNDEDNLDTRDISNEIEEGDEDYDDEESENDELTEEDFDIDEDEDDEDDID
jgi:segregation and condensation protein B